MSDGITRKTVSTNKVAAVTALSIITLWNLVRPILVTMGASVIVLWLTNWARYLLLEPYWPSVPSLPITFHTVAGATALIYAVVVVETVIEALVVRINK